MKQTPKRAELYEIRQRKKQLKRQQRLKKAKQTTKVIGRITLFILVVLILSGLSFKGITFLLEKQKAHVELESQKIFEAYDLKLSLGENGSKFTLYLQQKGTQEGEDSLLMVTLGTEQLSYADRKEFPTPYVKAQCKPDVKTCKIDEAVALTLHLKSEDISEITVK